MKPQEQVINPLPSSLIFHLTLALSLFFTPLLVGSKVEAKGAFFQNEPQGLFLNKTISYNAGLFYQKLGFLLLSHTELKHLTLTLEEQLNAKTGSTLILKQGTQVVFQSPLTPREKDIDRVVKEAFHFIAAQLGQNHGLAFGNPDLPFNDELM